MAQASINKQDFISCYMYLYGATKKEAAAVYKRVNDDYKKAVVDSIKQDAKSAFYND